MRYVFMLLVFAVITLLLSVLADEAIQQDVPYMRD